MTNTETATNTNNHGLRVLKLSSIRAEHRLGLCYIRLGVVISFSGHHRRLPPPETPIPEPPSNPLGPIAPTLTLYLVGDDGKFLGELTTNEFHSDGIFNEFGPYGSKFSSTSIWNEFGRYGSDFSTYSAFNEFASKPPLIVTSDGAILGKLTTNRFISGAISPYVIYAVLHELGR